MYDILYYFRSVVVASVSYGQNSVVDISQLQNQFGRNRTVVVGNTYTEDKSVSILRREIDCVI